ncbi:MAG: LytR/AlgR family response regulator transcription factor [Pseudomonadales bacterium]
MKPLRTIIVDDEPLARRGLKLRIENIPEIELVCECSNGHEALHAVATHSPDLLFLDIQMPTLSGFDVVQRMQGDTMPLVIFVTAFGQYALEAFDIHAVDYLLKPIDDTRLHEAVQRAVQLSQTIDYQGQKQQLMDLVAQLTGEAVTEVDRLLNAGEQLSEPGKPAKISIKDGQEVHIIPVNEIDWVDAAGDYMCIHSNSQTHIMRITMKQLEKMLDEKLFKRIHRSTIVNTSKAKKISTLGNGEYLLTLQCGAELKVSRSYKEIIRELV